MKYNLTFCGSSELSLGALKAMSSHGIHPNLIITRPDKALGRKLVVTETLVSAWAKENDITCLKPEKISEVVEYIENNQDKDAPSLCLVVSYGKILPEKFLNLFDHGVWNVHPSGLPLFRGPSPIASQILQGVTPLPVSLMKMDHQMDHGPILEVTDYHIDYSNAASNSAKESFIEKLELELGKIGGEMFIKNISSIIEKKSTPTEQDHSKATFTSFIKKEDGDVSSYLAENPVSLLKENTFGTGLYYKFLAYGSWPGTFFFFKTHENKDIRVKIISMQPNGECSKILEVLPEGKKVMSMESFLNGYAKF